MRYLAAFRIEKKEGGTVWTYAGSGREERDGSFTLHLLGPVDGRLHIRDAKTVQLGGETPPPVQACGALHAYDRGKRCELDHGHNGNHHCGGTTWPR